MNAMLLSAGLGRRMFPLTLIQPKPARIIVILTWISVSGCGVGIGCSDLMPSKTCTTRSAAMTGVNGVRNNATKGVSNARVAAERIAIA